MRERMGAGCDSSDLVLHHGTQIFIKEAGRRCDGGERRNSEEPMQYNPAHQDA